MDFTFNNPSARENARLIHALSRDLALIEQLKAPGIKDFLDAPVIEDWSIAHRTDIAITGIVTGHPRNADGRIITSPVHYLDPVAKFARTLSRWYRLSWSGGRPVQRDGSEGVLLLSAVPIDTPCVPGPLKNEMPFARRTAISPSVVPDRGKRSPRSNRARVVTPIPASLAVSS